MEISLADLPVYIINLDRSHDRWVRCHQSLSSVLPRENLHRISGVDGQGFIKTSSQSRKFRISSLIKRLFRNRSELASLLVDSDDRWKQNDRDKLQAEGLLGKNQILDPVRTALCLSHQRALHNFLQSCSQVSSKKHFGLIFEDDTRPGEALSNLNEALELDIPDDADVVFLHDRVWRRGASSHSENWRIVRGGIGLEAYLVTPVGAKKMLKAFTPVIEECDVQLMTFMEGYAGLELKEEIWEKLKAEGCTEFPQIKAYAPVRPYFQTDHWIPSVKFETMQKGDIQIP